MNPHMPRQAEPEFMDIPAEAAAYARADFSDVNQAFVDRLMELAAHLEAAAALDLGTGPGDIPVRVGRARPRWRLVAVDASAAMLDYAGQAVAAAGLSGSIELVLADAKDTGLPARSFDVVFSNSILHHVNATDRFWAELKRVGKPGAIVLLRDLARPESAEGAAEIVHRHAPGESEILREEFYRSLLSAYTPEEVTAQLARAKLESLAVAMASDRHLDVFGRLP